MSTISEDRDAIRDLYARYCLYFDRGEVAEWVALYTDDGEFVGAGQHVKGRQELATLGAGVPSGTMHRLSSNHVIDVDGDSARCHSSVVLLAGGVIASSGRTVDELRRVDGSWRVAVRTYTPDTDVTAPAVHEGEDDGVLQP